MCVIIYKPTRVIIALDELKAAWETNDQGAGFMWREHNKIQIRKGFMTFGELQESLEQHGFLKDDIVLDKLDMAFHFRIATSGGVCPERTHPFPIVKEYYRQEKLKNETTAALMHNGVISSLGGTDWSDTQECVSTVIYPVFREDMPVTELKKDIEEFFPNLSFFSSRLLIMTPKKTYFLGDFQTDEGIYYSNLNHRIRCKQIYATAYTDYDRTFAANYRSPNTTLRVMRQRMRELLPKVKLLTYCYEQENCAECKFFRIRKGRAICKAYKHVKTQAVQKAMKLLTYIQEVDQLWM
jgi:predicted glutamine amidotransferase